MATIRPACHPEKSRAPTWGHRRVQGASPVATISTRFGPGPRSGLGRGPALVAFSTPPQSRSLGDGAATGTRPTG